MARVAPKPKPDKSRPSRAKRLAESRIRNVEKTIKDVEKTVKDVEKAVEDYLSIVCSDQDLSTVEYFEEQQPKLIALGARLSSMGYQRNEQASPIDCSLDPQTQDVGRAIPMPPVSGQGLSDLAHVSPPAPPLPSRPPSPPPSPPAANLPLCPLSPPHSVSNLPTCSPAQFAKSHTADAFAMCNHTWSSISRLLHILSLPCPAMSEGFARYLRDVGNTPHGPSFRQLEILLG